LGCDDNYCEYSKAIIYFLEQIALLSQVSVLEIVREGADGPHFARLQIENLGLASPPTLFISGIGDRG
jgi:hypothetical protein